MFVTRTPLQGMTQTMGNFSIHAALLITILLYLPAGDFTYIEQQTKRDKPNDVSLRNLMIFTHAYLMVSTICCTQNLVEGIAEQILSYSGAIMYMLMMSEVVREIYLQPTLMELSNDELAMSRFLFFISEFIIYMSVLAGNFLFLTVRMLTPNQVKLIKIEESKRIAYTDTIETLGLVFAQY